MAKAKTPSAQAAAFRALALLALLIRTQAEQELSRNNNERPSWLKLLRRLKKWLKDENVEPHQSRQERIWLNKSLGLWEEGDVFNHIWQTEALAALLWALGRFKTMPAYDDMVDAQSVWDKLPVLEPTADFVAEAKLRSSKQLEHARHEAEFWHWRARTEELRRTGFTPPEGDTFKACIRRAAETARDLKFVARLKGDDVPILGKPYQKLTLKQYANAHSVAIERHKALNWLCGYSDKNDWDATPTNT